MQLEFLDEGKNFLMVLKAKYFQHKSGHNKKTYCIIS